MNYPHSRKNLVDLQKYYLPSTLAAEIAGFEDFFNHQHYHVSLDHFTPANVYAGHLQEILTRHNEIK